MADPISSLGSDDSLDCHLDDNAEATSSGAASASSAAPPSAALMCTPEPTASDAPPSGAQSLVARFTPPPALPKSVASSDSPVISRTTLSTSSGAVPGGGSYRVSATGLNTRVETGTLKGSSAEFATAYVQYGKDNDVQLTLARRTLAVSSHDYGVTVTAEAGVARANLGEKNDDGSIGGNIGSGVELAGVEVTVDTPVGSVTYGQSVSMSLGGSMGVRDADHDGKPEFCAKFSIPAYTVGACVEDFW
ncbi:MAG: hypothetical protein WDO69_10555 [Pseudomonadota bacterium]